MKRGVGLLFLMLLFSFEASAQWENKGYIKYRATHQSLPDHSYIRQLGGDAQLSSQAASLRLMTQKDWRSISAALHYDLAYLFSHQSNLVDLTGSDSGNFFDLTYTQLGEHSKQLLTQRIDRLYVHYRGEKLSAKLGRQALSWGHGLMFQVMDIFNPFSPVALDTDYKSGTDMFYSEWLFDSGDDAQGLYVPKRGTDNGLDMSASSYALKYHSLLFETDIDFVLARHDEKEVIGLGFARPIMQSMWRFDIMMHRQNDGQQSFALVTNLDYSWVWLEHNFYGFVEYFHNQLDGFDQGGMVLTEKHYLASSLRIELHPLVNISPSVFVNPQDLSGLVYISLYYDWMQDLNVSTSFIQPFGASDADFSGPLTSGQIFQLQLSAYF